MEFISHNYYVIQNIGQYLPLDLLSRGEFLEDFGVVSLSVSTSTEEELNPIEI